MAFERITKVFEADGETPYTAGGYYPDGLIHDERRGASFTLAAFGGCLGGRLPLCGTVRDALRLGPGMVVRRYLAAADGEPIYSGTINFPTKSIETQRPHEYELIGLWQEMERVELAGDEDETLGDGENDVETVDDAVAWVLEKVQAVLPRVTLGAIDGANTPLEKMIIKSHSRPQRVLEQLRLMPSANGGHYTAWIDAMDRFYFGPISTDVADRMATVEIGRNARRGDEEGRGGGRNIGNNIQVVFNTAAGARVKTKHQDATSVAKYGQARRLTLYMPELRATADVAKAGTGFMKLWADPELVLRDMAWCEGNATTMAPRPWAGQGVYTDTARGVQLVNYVFRAEYEWDSVLRAKLDVGDESEDAGLTFHPSEAIENDPAGEAMGDTITEGTEPGGGGGGDTYDFDATVVAPWVVAGS